jgi:hypothetical protein
MDNRVQAIRLKKKDYSLAEAKSIVRALGYKDTYYGKSPFTQTDNWYRFRQFNPDKYKQYITRKKEGIHYVIGVR